MLPDKNPSKEDFENFYDKTDPWGLNGNIWTEITIETLNKYFCSRKFENGIDLGCGEGFITSKLDFVTKWTGVDISENAINRGISNHPEVDFLVLDMNDLSELEGNIYDFILCLDAIYYLSKKQRKFFIESTLRLGHRDTVYCFSSVVSGPSEHREYPSFREACIFLSDYFTIQKMTPVSVKDLPLSRINQLILRFEKWFPLKKFRKSLCAKHLSRIRLESAHQVLFILRSI